MLRPSGLAMTHNLKTMKNKHILVTGGAGYIGSHMVRLLIEKKYNPIVFDNLSTGYKSFIPKGVPFVKGDLKKPSDIQKIFRKFQVTAIMHFAASKILPESIKKPLEYYDNNVHSAINLIDAAIKNKTNKFILSSTAAVYGPPDKNPVTEKETTKADNPYGQSKLMIERVLTDASRAYPLKFVSLRYFNVAGAHPKGGIGIKNKEATDLVTSVLKAASGKRKRFSIFGNNYPTRDGTCIRDFIHVMDLCEAHLFALRAINKGLKCAILNLGSNKGYSVKEVVEMSEKIIGKPINKTIGPRRPGDCVNVIASNKLAKKIIGWTPKTDLKTMLKTAWEWEISAKC